MIITSIIISIFYCIFFIWLTEGLRKISNEKHLDLNELPNVSIIISARNEEKNIPNLLTSLIQLSYPLNKLQILIVNDRSSDKTAEILKIAENEISILNVIHIKKTPIGWAPKKWALQQAIDKSINEIILQTDADCTFHPDWVQAMISEFRDATVGFVAGPAPIRFNNKFYDQFALMDSLSIDAISASTLKQGIALSCVGRNIGFRKTAFLDVGGYEGIEDQISGDDDLLMQKIAHSKKWAINYICNHNAIVNSPAPENIETFISQRLRFASKGLNYYKLNTNSEVLFILPFLYIVNLIIAISLSVFLSTQNALWLIPFFIKISADGLLTLTFFNQLKIKWSLLAFLILDLIHPFYVIIFGTIAPFHKIKWKN